MSQPAVHAEGLSKRYRIGALQQSRRTLGELLMQTLRRPLAPFRRQDTDATTLWALKDVSFEIPQGEVVGIIGRNGAGKSTLLKLLSRITDPTAGWVDIYGRVGSLLEVGTGFHGELTGRENIFLNGAILGMRKKQIEQRFDAIVSFSGVEKFIDTPVKFYSSGMYLRLAFAVAAHLDPDILLVDEVLAVGDTAFQNKCVGRMGEVAKEGRTVLFVSHNMGAIRSLCTSGIVLHHGCVIQSGDIGRSIETYYRLAADTSRESDESRPRRSGFGHVTLVGRESSTIQQSEPFVVATTLDITEEAAGFTLLCVLEDMNQRNVCHLREDSSNLEHEGGWRGRHRIEIAFPDLWLEPGMYTLYFKVLLWGTASAKHVSDMLHIDVGGKSCGWGSILSPDVEWRVQNVLDCEAAEVSLS